MVLLPSTLRVETGDDANGRHQPTVISRHRVIVATTDRVHNQQIDSGKYDAKHTASGEPAKKQEGSNRQVCNAYW
jgi:hypothetical protein